MHPASVFLIIQLSNSRENHFCIQNSRLYKFGLKMNFCTKEMDFCANTICVKVIE